ncbi:MAG: peptidase M64, partial [Candidatus Neomarinimicrobiota bacterium]
KYGGGGIFNLCSCCYIHDDEKEQSWWPNYVFVHEFGHAFAGLADEYYSSAVAYNEFYPPGVEPWEPNITALLDPENLKWKKLVEPDIPIPTPWNKEKYDKIPRSQSKDKEALLHKQEYWGKVGAFKGAGYASEGLYRPYLDCRMFSKSLTGFCPVCSDAIVKMIRFYSE